LSDTPPYIPTALIGHDLSPTVRLPFELQQLFKLYSILEINVTNKMNFTRRVVGNRRTRCSTIVDNFNKIMICIVHFQQQFNYYISVHYQRNEVTKFRANLTALLFFVY